MALRLPPAPPRSLRYFRLIEPPAPDTVRPQPVLERALAHVLAESERGADYKAFVNDQLK